MKDYYAVIGYACVNEAFRADLLAHGFAAVAMHKLSADLTPTDQERLNDFSTADPGPKGDAEQGFSQARIGLASVCQNPPCPYNP